MDAVARPIVQVVGPGDFPPAVWQRVKHLVAFRFHRPAPDGSTTTDAAIYVVRDSSLYTNAAAALRNGTTSSEYLWCLFAGVLAHEAAHTVPMTEREALTAEAVQIRRCLFAGHLHAADGWSAGAYLQQLEAKRRGAR